MKILFVGPILPPVHGQSLAFTRFYESVNNNCKILINTNFENYNKLVKFIATFKTLFLIFYKTLFYKYDVVYFTCSRSFLGSIKDILLINLASYRNIKLINHLHGSDFYEFLHGSSNWYKKILLKSYTKVDTSIVLLNSMRNQFKDFPNMKIEVVVNFYDIELDNILAEKDSQTINLLYLSNIIKSKGIFELIEAFEKLSSTYENIYLNIAGGFIADNYMSIDEIKEKFYKKISNNKKIKYIGKTFGEEKVELLQKSDIFVLPSYYKSEAFPISIIEAMRSGNAIVTTNYKYLPDVVKDKNGVLVKPKSIEDLVIGIDKLLQNSGKLKEVQEYNKHEAQEKYSLYSYINKLNDIILKKGVV